MATEPERSRAETLASVMQHDMARLVQQLGVQSLRASVVDLASMALQSGWSIAESGEVSDSIMERTLDSVFPGASARLSQLAQASDEDTMVQKLSPRRWAFAWRLDAQKAAMTEVQYQDRRDAISDTDITLVRLLCNSGIRAGLAAAPAATAAQALVWPQVDRRARHEPQALNWWLPGLVGASALLCAWLALVALPHYTAASAEQQAELARLHTMADSTLSHNLATVLASGDYGDVQTALAVYEAQGYLKSAAVTNAKERVVAAVGPIDRLRIGDPVAADFASTARRLELNLGSEKLGALLMVAPPATAAESQGVVRTASWLALVSALAALGLVAARLRPGAPRK